MIVEVFLGVIFHKTPRKTIFRKRYGVKLKIDDCDDDVVIMKFLLYRCQE